MRRSAPGSEIRDTNRPGSTMTDSLQDERLRDWSAVFSAAEERADAFVRDLSAEQLNFKPAPDRWSVGQCLDHIAVAMGIYLDPMEPAIERAAAREGRAGGRGTLMGRVLIAALRWPRGRYSAPRDFRPSSSDLEPAAVGREYARQSGRLRRALERCDGLAVDRVKMPWPVFGLIKISLAQAFELQALHTDRHLDQADRVTRAEGFPA